MWNFGQRHKHLKAEQLSEYLDGRLSPTACRQVEAEVARCASCRQELDALRRTAQLLQRLPVRAVQRSFVMAAPPVGASARVQPRPGLLLRAPQWAYAAAASVAILAFSALVSAELTGALAPNLPSAAPLRAAPSGSGGDQFGVLSAEDAAPLALNTPEGSPGSPSTSQESGIVGAVPDVPPLPDATPAPPAPSESQRAAELKGPVAVLASPTPGIEPRSGDPAAASQSPAEKLPDETGRVPQNGDKLIPPTPADGGMGIAAAPSTGQEGASDAAGLSAAAPAEKWGGAADVPAREGETASAAPESATNLASSDAPSISVPPPATPLVWRVLQGVTAALGLVFLAGLAARWQQSRRTRLN